MEIDLANISALLQTGGTPALALCTYFIYKLESRLARIEKAFEMVAQKLMLPKESDK